MQASYCQLALLKAYDSPILRRGLSSSTNQPMRYVSSCADRFSVLPPSMIFAHRGTSGTAAITWDIAAFVRHRFDEHAIDANLRELVCAEQRFLFTEDVRVSTRIDEDV